jgi:inorganic pyrophosphatase
MTQEVDVFIEISKNSHIKYEYDNELHILKCDRILHTPFNYFFNYGFIPNTLSLDGDALDVIVLMDDELIPGCLIRCKILGCLETSDDHGDDPKLIVCPVNRIDPTNANINNISDIPNHTLDKIVYFFSHYKDLEQKIVNIGKMLDSNDATYIYNESCLRFLDKKCS